MSRWFLYLAPEWYDKMDLIDVDEPHVTTDWLNKRLSGSVDPRFIERAQPGDFYDVERGGRLLIRLGENFTTKLEEEDDRAGG